MSAELHHGERENVSRADWSIPKPDAIPPPTYFPAAMAFGITLFLWGFVTSPVVLSVGLLVMVASLVGWVREIVHDQQ